MSGASNTLAREFLTDVHQLCSAVAQRAEAREEDEEESHMVALGEYLVRGRGFLLLSTLDSIIDQVRMNGAPVASCLLRRSDPICLLVSRHASWSLKGADHPLS